MNSEKTLPENTIIFGYGWLGEIIAKRILENSQCVFGITRNQDKIDELISRGGDGISLILDPQTQFPTSIPLADVGIIALPPGIRAGRGEQFPKTIENILSSCGSLCMRWVLISSTSVYPQIEGVFKEGDVEVSLESEQVLLQAEAVFLKYVPHGLILRLAGLFGMGRHPINFLAGRENVANGDSPVNLISGEDVAEVIDALMRINGTGVFNVCSLSHPTKKEYYVAKAEEFGLKHPHFLEGGPNRIISSQKLEQWAKFHGIQFNFSL